MTGKASALKTRNYIFQLTGSQPAVSQDHLTMTVDYQHKSGYIFFNVKLDISDEICAVCMFVFYCCILFSNYKICLLQVWVPGPMCSSSHTDITNLVNWILLGENQPSIHNIIHHLPGSSSSTKNDRVCGVSFVAIIVGNRCFIFLFPWQNVSLNKRMCAE